jgi:hypothetical protein
MKITIIINENMSLTKITNELREIDKSKKITNLLEKLPSATKRLNLSLHKNLSIKDSIHKQRNENTPLSKIVFSMKEIPQNDLSFTPNAQSISTYDDRYSVLLEKIPDKNDRMVKLAILTSIKIEKNDPEFVKKMTERINKIKNLDIEMTKKHQEYLNKIKTILSEPT